MIWKRDYDLLLTGSCIGLATYGIVDYFSLGLNLSAVTPMDIVFYIMMAVAFFIHGKSSGSQGGVQ